MVQRRVPELSVYEYQQNVLDKDLSTPPISPVEGNRYIVGPSATGAWLGKEKQIAWFFNAVWNFDVPAAGWLVYVADEAKRYQHNGTIWELEGAADMFKSVYDTDNDGIVDKSENVDDGAGNASTAVQVKSAVTLKHTQGTDQHLDFGGVNQISAADAKTAFDSKGSFNASLKVVVFELP